MSPLFLAIAVFMPIVGGILLALTKVNNRRVMLMWAEGVTVVTTCLVWTLLLNKPAASINVFPFVEKIDISFAMDGLSMIFAGMISVLWPLAVLYSFEYMEHDSGPGKISEKTFFAMYIVTYGVTLGIAFSKSMMTMYIFYEMLTLVTIPLVLFSLTKEAVNATRTYMYFSLGGAAFGFISLIFIIVYGNTIDFTYGGVLNIAAIGNRINILRLIYVLAFVGFGVKAAVCPVNAWLPKACVAPTPVTALLHAVAVVKSGAFAVIRLTYYSFGTAIIKDSWAQYTVMGIAMITILYGSIMAVKERHIKRRLAYSTISNLSYILLGATLMSQTGLEGSLLHMLFHAVMKICAFFCIGCVITKKGFNYIDEIEGLGKKMPVTFGIFTIAAVAVMGFPGLCGFVGKWYLAAAAVEDGRAFAIAGVAVLIISAILTAVYMLEIVIKAFFPTAKEGANDTAHELCEKCDPSWRMIVPLVVFAAFIIVFGLFPKPLIGFVGEVAKGVF